MVAVQEHVMPSTPIVTLADGPDELRGRSLMTTFSVESARPRETAEREGEWLRI